MEQFDLYNKEGMKLHKSMNRGGSNQPGEYHLVVHIWIRNSQGQYLIQQRNKPDDEVLYQWASTGGAVLVGEDSIPAAIRETYEEIGYQFLSEDLQLVKRYYIENPKANYITDLYLINADIDLNTLTLDPVEVKAVQYKTMNEIKQLIQKNQFWDYARLMERSDYFDILEKSYI